MVLTMHRTVVEAVQLESQFHANLAQLFLDQQDTNVTFCLRDLLKPNEQKILKAHKCILSAASDVFNAMLYGPMQEKDTIYITDVPYQAFKWLLWILYRQKIVAMPKKYEHIPFYGRDIYMAAHKYNTQEALMLIRDVIVCRLKSYPSESLVWYEMAQMYVDPLIERAAMNGFMSKTTEVLSCKDIRDCAPETLEVIFKQEILDIKSEFELVTTLEDYLMHNKEYQPEHEKIKNIKRHIRFLKLTKKQIRDTSVLTSQEKIDILYCHGSIEENRVMQKLQFSFSKMMRDKPIPNLRRTPRKSLKRKRTD